MNCPSPAPSSTYASMAPALIHTDLEHAYRLGTQRLEEWGVHTVVPVLGDLVRAGIGQRRNKAWPFISFTRPSTRLRMHAFGCSLWKRYRQRSRASEQASDEHGRWELVQHLARYHMRVCSPVRRLRGGAQASASHKSDRELDETNSDEVYTVFSGASTDQPLHYLNCGVKDTVKRSVRKKACTHCWAGARRQ